MPASALISWHTGPGEATLGRTNQGSIEILDAWTKEGFKLGLGQGSKNE